MPTSAYLAIAAMLAVLIVLAFGILSLRKGGQSNTSQKLMRWRIGLQFLAVILLMITLYMYSK